MIAFSSSLRVAFALALFASFCVSDMPSFLDDIFFLVGLDGRPGFGVASLVERVEVVV